MKTVRRNMLAGGAILMSTVLMFALVPIQVYSETPAEVTVGFSCGLLDGEMNSVITTDSHAVNTYSNKGNTKLSCHAENVYNPTGKAVHWNYDNTGLTCGDLWGHTTTNWRITVSYIGDNQGNATLTCHFKQ